MANIKKPSQSCLDFFVSTHHAAAASGQAVKGTCNSMCPEEEMYLRRKERMVHVLEVVGDQQKLVKCYCRPAADTNLAIAHNLRPFHVLKKTIDYLLFEVTKRKDVSSLIIYNFVVDRMRAIRQDMIIQELAPEQRVELLEPMIRFHIFYGYLLCEESIKDYSPTLNRNFLLECLKTCLYCYDMLDFVNTNKSHDMSLLINDMENCILEDKDQRRGRKRELMEALYVLTNLYEESPMWRLRRLSETIRHAPPVRRAYKLASTMLHGHYVSVVRTLPKLCPLTFCAVALLLPTLQRRAVQVMCTAYSSRGRGPPLRAVRAWLGCAEDAAARATLRHYGLADKDGLVECARTAYRHDVPTLPPRKIKADHLEDKMNIDYILKYSPNDNNSYRTLVTLVQEMCDFLPHFEY